MKKDLAHILAVNIKAARLSKGMDSMRALAMAADVAPNSVKNLEEPETRTPNMRGSTSPRMDVVEKIAKSMGYECWQLMIESFKPDDPPFTRPLTTKEAKAYSSITKNFKDLPPLE